MTGTGAVGSGLGTIVSTVDGATTQASSTGGTLLGGVLQTAGNAVLATSGDLGATGAPAAGATAPVTGLLGTVGQTLTNTGTSLDQKGVTGTVNGLTAPVSQVASVSAAGQNLVGGGSASPIGLSVLSPTTTTGTDATIGVANGDKAVTVALPVLGGAGAGGAGGAVSGVVQPATNTLSGALGSTSVLSVNPSGTAVGSSVAPLIGANVNSAAPTSGSLATASVLSGGQLASVNAPALTSPTGNVLTTPLVGGSVATNSVTNTVNSLTAPVTGTGGLLGGVLRH